jgi:hypothetical protein
MRNYAYIARVGDILGVWSNIQYSIHCLSFSKVTWQSNKAPCDYVVVYYSH